MDTKEGGKTELLSAHLCRRFRRGKVGHMTPAGPKLHSPWLRLTSDTGNTNKKSPKCLSLKALMSTPHWVRTSNLRFRRPMLYPIELGVLSLLFSTTYDD